MRVNNQTKAFTIIEVVLVLAVAGLIFLVVFAAIPRLQASRRDNQRKRDAEAIISFVIDYQANTGDYPTTGAMDLAYKDSGGVPAGSSPFDSYTDPSMTDPSTGINYHYNGTISAFEIGDFIFLPHTNICNAAGNSVIAGSPGDYVLVMELERGRYCLDSR